MADFVLRQGDTLPSLEAFIYEGEEEEQLPADTAVTCIVWQLPDVAVLPVQNYNWQQPPDPPAPSIFIGGPAEQGNGYVDVNNPHRVAYDWPDGKTDTMSGPYVINWKLVNEFGTRTYPPKGGQSLVVVESSIAIPRQTLVDPDDVIEEYNLGELTPIDRDRLTRLIAKATGRVERYLRRSVIIGVYTEDLLLGGGIPSPGATFEGVLGDLWGVRNLPLIQVLSIRELNSGYFRLTYIGGIDGRQYPEIQEWIAAKAASDFLNRVTSTGAGGRPVTSITVEGQSKSFAGVPVVEVPPLQDLDRYRVRMIYSRPRTKDPYAR